MMSIFNYLFRCLFKEYINGEKIAIQGLLPHIPDPRDFLFKNLGGWIEYKPKNVRLELPILEIKTQAPNNTCVFHSYAACREQSEKVPLSPRSIVLYAKSKGYLSSDGISSIRNGQQAGIEFGIAEESILNNDNLDWRTYSGVSISDEIKNNASKHKGKSYFWLTSKNEWLKALDEGHAIHTGFDWYSSYNMSSGFSSPWILPWRRGYKVGGHAVCCIGYDIPQQLMIFQNSFGPDWGNNGKFYIKMADIFKENPQAAVTVDLEGDGLGAFITSHEGHDVKSSDIATIYRIQDGKKRPFPDENTFFAYGGTFEEESYPQTFQDVASSFLNIIPIGDPMDVQSSPFWGKLQPEWQNILWMHYPDNMKKIRQIISS